MHLIDYARHARACRARCSNPQCTSRIEVEEIEAEFQPGGRLIENLSSVEPKLLSFRCEDCNTVTLYDALKLPPLKGEVWQELLPSPEAQAAMAERVAIANQPPSPIDPVFGLEWVRLPGKNGSWSLQKVPSV